MSFSQRIRKRLIRRLALGLVVAAVAAPSATASTYGPLGQVLASKGQLSYGLTLPAVNARSLAGTETERPSNVPVGGGFTPIARVSPGNGGALSVTETGAGIGIGIAAALGLTALGAAILRRHHTAK